MGQFSLGAPRLFDEISRVMRGHRRPENGVAKRETP